MRVNTPDIPLSLCTKSARSFVCLKCETHNQHALQLEPLWLQLSWTTRYHVARGNLGVLNFDGLFIPLGIVSQGERGIPGLPGDVVSAKTHATHTKNDIVNTLISFYKWTKYPFFLVPKRRSTGRKGELQYNLVSILINILLCTK